MGLGKTLKSIVGTVAPGIATALGGPVAGMAVKALSGAVFGNDAATEQDLVKELSGWTPDQMIKLKEIDHQFILNTSQQGIDIFSKEVEDRSNAREMAVKTTLVPQMVISGIILVGFFAVLYSLMGREADLPAATRDVLLILLGGLSTAVSAVVGFWLGSSYGSAAKNDQSFSALTTVLGKK